MIPKDVLEVTLRGLKDEVEFVDELGEVLGHFTPAIVKRELEDSLPPLAELERRV